MACMGFQDSASGLQERTEVFRIQNFEVDDDRVVERGIESRPRCRYESDDSRSQFITNGDDPLVSVCSTNHPSTRFSLMWDGFVLEGHQAACSAFIECPVAPGGVVLLELELGDLSWEEGHSLSGDVIQVSLLPQVANPPTLIPWPLNVNLELDTVNVLV